MKRFLSLFVFLPIVLLTACAPTPVETAQPPATQAPATTALPDTPVPDPFAGTFMARPAADQLRLLNYNINWDSIFPDDDSLNHIFRDYNNVEQFERVLSAIQPDIICLEEINGSRHPDSIAALINDIIPSETGWYATAARDNFIIARYPVIVGSYKIGGNYQGAALIDLPDEQYGETDFYIICSHFKSGGDAGDISRRQEQADVLVNHMRDAQTPGGRIDLPTNTPFMMMGDFNIYDTDPAYHITTLITGDIIDEDQFGEDYPPDWDRTSMTDALPSHNGAGEETYTWRDDSDRFTPGPLDRIIYSDSVITVTNAFVLNTTTLSVDLLTLFGLQANDVVLNPASGNYDHLPMVLDFVFNE